MINLPSIALLLLITLISAVTCHKMAKKRGRNPVFWGSMGVIFGPIAIPIIFVLKKT